MLLIAIRKIFHTIFFSWYCWDWCSSSASCHSRSRRIKQLIWSRPSRVPSLLEVLAVVNTVMGAITAVMVTTVTTVITVTAVTAVIMVAVEEDSLSLAHPIEVEPASLSLAPTAFPIIDSCIDHQFRWIVSGFNEITSKQYTSITNPRNAFLYVLITRTMNI